jgi:hypothetical protein
MDVANGEAEIDLLSTKDEVVPVKKRKTTTKNNTKKK